MERFENKIYIFGYGMVGKSFLRLLKEEVDFKMENLYVIDMSKDEKEEFLKEGGLKENYLVIHIRKDNYKKEFERLLKAGDTLLDFSEKTKNIDTFKWCLNNDVFYLSTSDSTWPEDDANTTSYDNFLYVKELTKKYSKGYPTAAIEIGCNPGIVSLFVKQGLREVVEVCGFNEEKKKDLRNLFRENKYGKVAKELEVEAVIISDYDTLSVNDNLEDDDSLANTWSPSGLYDEAISNVEFTLGTSFNIELIKDKIKVFNPEDGYCMLNLKGLETLEKTYSPHGYFEGHLITHEENLTLGSYLSVYEDNKLVYNPTVYFSYRPSEVAFRALSKVKEKGYQKPKSFIKLSSTLKKGGEYVGVIIKSNKCGTYYYGSGIDIIDLRKTYPNETPTIIQVTASAVSAFKWMIKNPKEGLVLPEDLPEDFILNEAKKYLGNYRFDKMEEEVIPLKGLLIK